MDMSARSQADAHFKTVRDAKTTTASKRINQERMKTDSDKSARLKAARLARDVEGAREAK
ncbi:hypothetical protein GGR03_003725 [Aurantimonas endophytica]|uniref:Uncharacterized protein n=1 Tax=Aurantimonas endophytica TaxID=1522175 RepID=A0A7W6HG68_9HYPH|nr:hypothetical protein [Aurantimonas endophytica]